MTEEFIRQLETSSRNFFADLEYDRVVKFQEAENYANEHGFHYVKETSAKSGFNAKEVFIQAAKILYLEHLKYKRRGNIGGNSNFNNNNNNIPVKIKTEPKRIKKDKKYGRKKKRGK